MTRPRPLYTMAFTITIFQPNLIVFFLGIEYTSAQGSFLSTSSLLSKVRDVLQDNFYLRSEEKK